MSPQHAGHSQEKVSTKPTVRDDKVLSTRYHELQFEASWEQWRPPDNHHCYINDNSDALINMGYLSPSESTHVDPPEIPILQSPHKSPSPSPMPTISICRSPHLDTTFSLELRSSSSSPPCSSSSPCSTKSCSPLPTPLFCAVLWGHSVREPPHLSPTAISRRICCFIYCWIM